MFCDKYLSIALLISTVFHAAMILPLVRFRPLPESRPLNSLQVTYVAARRPNPKQAILPQKTAVGIMPKPAVAQKNSQAKRRNNLVTRKKTASKIERLAKSVKSDTINRRAKVEIPPELPKEKEALYLDYYESIRARIRQLVIENYPRFIARGEVRLYFVLSAKGELREIKIIEERSTPNRRLKEIARKSLRQASPFLPFPKRLGTSELSFNVLISFELEN